MNMDRNEGMQIGDRAVHMSFRYRARGHLAYEGRCVDFDHVAEDVVRILARHKIVDSEYSIWEKIGDNPLKTKAIRTGKDIRELLQGTLF